MKVKNYFRLSVLTLSLTATTASMAAGFMLQEQNAVQTGDFGAGGAAIAEDASTAWFNPAGLTRLDKPQLVLAANEILFKTNYSGLVTYNNSTMNTIFDPPVQVGAINESQHVSNVDGGTSNFIPVFHLAYPITPKVVAGLSVTTPFGLSTKYDASTYVRYANTQTKLQVTDISPSIGFQVTDKTSVGFGVDMQRLLATFDNYADINPQSTQYQALTLSHNKASDWAQGWHAGILFQPSNATRFGLAYHSKVIHHASGYSTFSGPAADPDYINDIIVESETPAYGTMHTGASTTTVNLPASTMLSAYHDMNNRWALMGSVVYTQWNIFQETALNNVMASQVNLTEDSVLLGQKLVNVVVPQHFHNTWRASIGTNYKFNDQWLARTGVGYDESPVNNSYRNLRLPDSDRYAVALGARYQATKAVALDAGWTHEFIQTARLNNTTTQDVQSTTIIGKSYSHADVIGLQMTWSFA